jgi:hypothetical protein
MYGEEILADRHNRTLNRTEKSTIKILEVYPNE